MLRPTSSQPWVIIDWPQPYTGVSSCCVQRLHSHVSSLTDHNLTQACLHAASNVFTAMGLHWLTTTLYRRVFMLSPRSSQPWVIIDWPQPYTGVASCCVLRLHSHGSSLTDHNLIQACLHAASNVFTAMGHHWLTTTLHRRVFMLSPRSSQPWVIIDWPQPYTGVSSCCVLRLHSHGSSLTDHNLIQACLHAASNVFTAMGHHWLTTTLHRRVFMLRPTSSQPWVIIDWPQPYTGVSSCWVQGLHSHGSSLTDHNLTQACLHAESKVFTAMGHHWLTTTLHRRAFMLSPRPSQPWVIIDWPQPYTGVSSCWVQGLHSHGSSLTDHNLTQACLHAASNVFTAMGHHWLTTTLHRRVFMLRPTSSQPWVIIDWPQPYTGVSSCWVQGLHSHGSSLTDHNLIRRVFMLRPTSSQPWVIIDWPQPYTGVSSCWVQGLHSHGSSLTDHNLIRRVFMLRPTSSQPWVIIDWSQPYTGVSSCWVQGLHSHGSSLTDHNLTQACLHAASNVFTAMGHHCLTTTLYRRVFMLSPRSSQPWVIIDWPQPYTGMSSCCVQRLHSHGSSLSDHNLIQACLHQRGCPTSFCTHYSEVNLPTSKILTERNIIIIYSVYRLFTTQMGSRWVNTRSWKLWSLDWFWW